MQESPLVFHLSPELLQMKGEATGSPRKRSGAHPIGKAFVGTKGRIAEFANKEGYDLPPALQHAEAGRGNPYAVFPDLKNKKDVDVETLRQRMQQAGAPDSTIELVLAVMHQGSLQLLYDIPQFVAHGFSEILGKQGFVFLLESDSRDQNHRYVKATEFEKYGRYEIDFSMPYKTIIGDDAVNIGWLNATLVIGDDKTMSLDNAHVVIFDPNVKKALLPYLQKNIGSAYQAGQAVLVEPHALTASDKVDDAFIKNVRDFQLQLEQRRQAFAAQNMREGRANKRRLKIKRARRSLRDKLENLFHFINTHKWFIASCLVGAVGVGVFVALCIFSGGTVVGVLPFLAGLVAALQGAAFGGGLAATIFASAGLIIAATSVGAAAGGVGYHSVRVLYWGAVSMWRTLRHIVDAIALSLQPIVPPLSPTTVRVRAEKNHLTSQQLSKTARPIGDIETGLNESPVTAVFKRSPVKTSPPADHIQGRNRRERRSPKCVRDLFGGGDDKDQESTSNDTVKALF